jgi:hypothetical protein
MNTYKQYFYLWVLHPVAHLSNLVSYDAVNRNKVSIRQLLYTTYYYILLLLLHLIYYV